MNTNTHKKIIWFIALTLALTWGWWLIVELVDGMGALPPIGMFGPMIAALIVQKFIAKEPILGKNGLGFIVGKKRYWIIGPALIALLLLAIYGVTYLVNPALFYDKVGLVVSLTEASVSLGDSLPMALLVLFGMNVLLAPFINIPLMLGEEVGWRGFLTPNMMRLYGKQGLIWANVVWALWHVPMFFQGLNYGSNPWLGILFAIPLYVSLGIIFQTMFQRSGGSIWVVGLMHGVLNQGTMTVMNFLLVEDASFNSFVYGPSGIIGIMIFGITAVYFYRQFEVEEVMLVETAVSKQFSVVTE